MADTTALDLYNLLVTRDFEPEILDSQGKAVTDPSQAELFSFDYKTDDKNYGTVVVLLGKNQELTVYFGDNVGRTMEGDDKRGWYRFLEQMKEFAVRNLMRFELNNLNRLKYSMQGMAAIKEGLFESYYGGRRVSYSGAPKESRLMIRHSRDMGEGDARHRAVESLFIETTDGQRFRLPFKNLTGGRAMLTHCRNGGTPYDAFGQHISQMMSEMSTMARFIRAARGRDFQGEAAAMVESAIRHYADIKAKAKRMISTRGYQDALESFNPAEFTDSEVTAEAIRDMFLERTLDHRIEEAIPVLARLSERGPTTPTQEFEQWAESMTEGTWALPDNPAAKEKMSALMSQELTVGPDATNATEQLYDLVGDDQLFDILDDLALRDPDANIWDDAKVQARLAELGITDLEPTPEPTQEASRGRPLGSGRPFGTIDNRDDGSPRIGRVEKTATGLKHYARPERGGSEPDADPLDHLDRATTNKIEKALGIKWPRQKHYQGGIDTTTENFGGTGLQGAAVGASAQGLDPAIDERDVEEDLDTDGVMMNKPSNMSSESREYDHFRRLVELAKS